ncbi:MAG: pyruvate kinase [Christensenellaceae bacterium]|nr:pyruvate kinase [Christensenellaceae bacterium]
MEKNNKKEVKIVCTIGPASESVEILTGLVKAGMNIARCNFSHGSHTEHKNKFDNVRKVCKELNKTVELALDTKGPELRLRDFENPPIEVKTGDTFSFYCDGRIGTQSGVSVSHDDLYNRVKTGDNVSVYDGRVKLVVDKVVGKEIICTVTVGGKLANKKNMNVAGVDLGLPFISAKDREDLELAVREKVDYIFASFVSCADDVIEMRKIVGDIKIIAKIECMRGFENLDEIVKVADGIMVARGDLGYEYPIEKIPTLQKTIIKKANEGKKFVICATEMMESMTNSPRPTRAETTDVANAIYDGADAVMLSGETATGTFPIETVTYMRAIADEAISQLAVK